MSFGDKNRKEEGQNWWEWYRWQPERYQAPYRIAFAFVATHNHFVLDRGGKVFNRSAPIIKLPASATEDDHLALLAYLNSSTACFWMKQVFYPKGTHSEARPEKGIPEDNRYEFAGTGLQPLPVPDQAQLHALLPLVREMETLATERMNAAPERVIAAALAASDGDLHLAVAQGKARDQRTLERMVALQEDMDWQIYALFGLAEPALTRAFSPAARLLPEGRPFNAAAPEPPLLPEDQPLWQARKAAISASPELALIETPLYKRRFWGARGVFASKVATYEERAQDAAQAELATLIEDLLRREPRILSLREIESAMASHPQAQRLLRYLGGSEPSLAPVGEVCRREAVPYLAAWRYSEEGLKKRRLWEETWALQRREDAGETLPAFAPPPRYDTKDFRDPIYWRHRGKLDVPKERFISYPGGESDEDGAPVYGWAGWDHREQALALGTLYSLRKSREAWPRERLWPLLAGLGELLPWLKQWHNQPSPEYDGQRLGDFYEEFVAAEALGLGLQRQDLGAFRPPGRGSPTGGGGRGRRRAVAGSD